MQCVYVVRACLLVCYKYIVDMAIYYSSQYGMHNLMFSHVPLFEGYYGCYTLCVGTN